MCGISGFTTVAGVDSERVIAAQLRSLAHRGPDAEGAYRGAGAVIAQNRLAVIDLDGGNPPITNEDGTAGVVCNGEIYNFRALQAELTERGHRLRTRCDTEVIVHLAEEGDAVQLARRLDGMFAFAVWDERARRLVLGCDRLGKKPLYYYSDGPLIVFGSEIKAVLAHPRVPRRLDERAIPAYLAFGYVPTPETFYEGIRRLPPGCVLTITNSEPARVQRYWDPAPAKDSGAAPPRSLGEAAAAVRELLSAAVARRLVADVPIGALLSGGVDSSAVVGVMASLLDRPVETFTIGFEDSAGFDERPYARAVAERFKTNHHEFVVAPDAAGLLERLVWHHDQPFGDSSAIPTFLLCELARAHVPVALGGDGGDELFGGYERFAAGLAVGPYLRIPRPLRRSALTALRTLPPSALGGRGRSALRFAAGAERGLPDAYLAWVSLISAENRRALLPRWDDWAGDAYRQAWSSTAQRPLLERMLALNRDTYLPDDLLVKADRTSMAHALELRSPLLDLDLLRYAESLPPKFKIRGPVLKRVLKAAVADLLPPELLRRRKHGFGVPLDRWFRGELRGYLRGRLLAPGARVRQHLVPAAIERIASEHDSGARNHGHALWTLLTLEAFLRREGW